MSDYVKEKVVRLPLTAILPLQSNESDIHEEAEKLLEEKVPELVWSAADGYPRFEVGGCYDYKNEKSNYYFDYVIESSYGEDSGDWGISQKLSDEEFEKYLPLFEKLGTFDKHLLKKVAYCYYNGCDCEDYYTASEDIFDL